MTEYGIPRNVPDRAPNTCWILRNGEWDTQIRTAENERIEVIVNNVVAMSLSRNDARLVARRILSCLSETRRGANLYG
jgi:hypothetical protein